MINATEAQFVSAGIHLYPRCGYQKLSEEAVAAHLNADVERFRQLFADKDKFVKAMLREYRDRVLGRVSFDFSSGLSSRERLRQLLWRLAVVIRSNLPWVNRLLLDSADGVVIIRRALKMQNEIMALGVMAAIRACHADGDRDVSDLELLNQYDFLQGAVLTPMVLNVRFQKFDILSDDICCRVPDLLTDAFIQQRIDWVLNALFPE
ncbi:AcrR family transcriptional regulator [Neisseria perflava]|uniref:TetR/AcrR family transcriptional regulator n=1 Tax=Neisseria perflava TaxID=33053 RepID=UPI0020A2078E|nr:hypothetical protein [Neisseria perflava]MCP1771859.1 AcrR family transcriptional regulator [Neisseria perflava]